MKMKNLFPAALGVLSLLGVTATTIAAQETAPLDVFEDIDLGEITVGDEVLAEYVQIAALGAVLAFAVFSLFDVRSLWAIWKIDRREVGLSVITTLGVVAVGAINAILLAVALARFIRLTARPRDEVLGKVEGLPGFHSIERHPGARTFSGLALYRFNGPITFF